LFNIQDIIVYSTNVAVMKGDIILYGYTLKGAYKTSLAEYYTSRPFVGQLKRYSEVLIGGI
jgi:hypothetical protein